MLSRQQVEEFVAQGFVHLPGAFPADVAARCRDILWRMSGLDPDDPAGWTQPVVRLGGSGEPPFREAANTPALREAFDQLVGPGRWAPRYGLGTFPLRFPHPDDPGDAGWHVEGSFAAGSDTWPWLNLRSRGRALLMLFLFTEVGDADAPTRVKVGSHLDVPPFLAPAGDEGMSVLTLCQRMDEAGRLDAPDRPLALATGEPGDVYLCHPFVVHGAQPHHGTRPRFMAQPPLDATGLLDLDRADGDHSPVEIAVRRGLGLA